MDGAQNGYGAFFSPANFGDCDESIESLAKEFTSAVDYISIRTCMENLSIATINLIENELVNKNSVIIDSDNHYTKNKYTHIKSKLTLLGCAGHLEQIQKFMKPIEEQITYERIQKFSGVLKVNNFNNFAQDFFKETVIDISGTEFFNSEFGIDLDTFRQKLKAICSAYDGAYFDLFDAEEKLMQNIKKFEEFAIKMNTLLGLDINDATLDVFSAFTKYIGIFFKEQNLNESFEKFLKARKRFIVLRETIQSCQKTIGRTDESSEPPLCSICMNAPVKMAFVPCGHTFCLACASKIHSNCYICRTKINSKLKLYYI